MEDEDLGLSNLAVHTDSEDGLDDQALGEPDVAETPARGSSPGSDKQELDQEGSIEAVDATFVHRRNHR